MKNNEAFETAISLLREWIYELAPLDEENNDPFNEHDIKTLKRDYTRLCDNTSFFLDLIKENLEEVKVDKPKPPEKPKPPKGSLIQEGSEWPLCKKCGSSLKRKLFCLTSNCINPECENYFDSGVYK